MDWTLLIVVVLLFAFTAFLVWVFQGEVPQDEDEMIANEATEFEPDYSLYEGDE